MTPQTDQSPLKKALDCGVTISGAFLDDDDYLDHVAELRRHWQSSQIKQPRAKEWVGRYPELAGTFKRLIAEKETEVEAKKIKVKILLEKELKSLMAELSRDVLLEIGLLKEISVLEREIRWLKLGLIVADVKQNGLTEDQIQRARDFPVEDLIDTKRINKMWCCPFHEERTPSFHIYKENSWHCFGCQAHGSNAIDYVMKKNKLEFVDAVKYLIDK